MRKLFTFRFMLIALFAAMSMTMNAEVIEYNSDDGFKYNLDTETKNAELAKYSGSATEVTIPAHVTYDGVEYSVTKLKSHCFYGSSSITSVTIPSSVTSLGEMCFAFCSALESISVDKNNTVFDSRENCNAIIETATNTMVVGCKATVIPTSVTSLGVRCFNGCDALTSISIPSSVTSLGNYCFAACYSLTSITIPSSVTSMGEDCIGGCYSLESMIVEKDNKVYDSRDNCNAIIETSTNRMIQGCKTTVIPSSVTSLGNYCFSGCSSLTSIDIPSSVTSLGDDCFSRCSSLTSINIPSSVTSLGESCFFGCSSLTSIDIPSSVTSLGDECFRKCSSLTSINIPSSVTSLGKYCFSYCSSLTSIDIPSSVTSLGDYCFYGCN